VCLKKVYGVCPRSDRDSLKPFRILNQRQITDKKRDIPDISGLSAEVAQADVLNRLGGLQK